MIKLKKQSLQDFQKITGAIKRNDLLPALKNLKLELVDGKNIITKSNLALTCVAEINGAYDKAYTPLLLDERILFGFISESRGDEVIIRIGDKLINLSDGTNNINLPKEDVSNYPRVPSPIDDASYLITKDHIGSIKIARKFANDSEAAGNHQFVHIKKNYIAAFNHHFFYVNSKFDDLPEMMLTPEQADVVSSFDQDLMFDSSDNHYFFVSPTVKYIFTRMEGVTPDIPIVIERLKTPGKGFTLPRGEFVNFCNIANVVSETPISDCSLSVISPGMAKLLMVDANYSRAFQKELSIQGELDEFNFNARIVVDPFKAIPTDILNCKTTHNCLIITGDDEWYCFIGMSKANANV